MKKIIFKIWLIVFVAVTARTQNYMAIHHINIGNGDCTVISLYDNNNNIITKTIIDGGNSNFANFLGPYLNQEFGNGLFNLLILSHFHKDHYNGLTVIANGTIQAANIIDGGYYTIAAGPHNVNLQPTNVAFPPPRAPGAWENAISNYGNNVNVNAARLPNVNVFPAQIGNVITLGTINGVNVTLTCIAGNGSNLAPGFGAPAVVNNIVAGRNNQNNFSLGWLLQFGQFRYYTAGDIGGQNGNYVQNIPYYGGGNININGSCGGYTNQETGIAGALQQMLPAAQPYGGGGNVTGHVCAVKMSHHGSACSNNVAWLGTLRPTAFFTSVGGNNSWKLPKLNTLYNMSMVAPLSNVANPLIGLYNQGYYFTNLFNFAGAGHDSRNYANWLFAARANTAYDFGNSNPNTNGSYMLYVSGQNIANVSEFAVVRVNCPFNVMGGISQYEFAGRFICHQ
jgi:hypothetical protein